MGLPILLAVRTPLNSDLTTGYNTKGRSNNPLPSFHSLTHSFIPTSLQILPAEGFITNRRNGCVKLRREEAGLGSEEPISIPTMLKDISEAYPEVSEAERATNIIMNRLLLLMRWCRLN